MKLDQNKESTVDRDGDEAKSSSRRRFLRRSSATALVTSLAVQPVWGQCTVSGALSGASNVQPSDDPCIVPNVSGRSPGFWSAAMYNGQAVISAFPADQNSDAKKLRCYIDDVKEVNSYTVPKTPDSNAQKINVADALHNPGSTGGNNWNLAAIWLDAYFGFFDGVTLPGRTNPTEQDWVEHFFALHLVGGDDVFNAVFDDEQSSTHWFHLPENYSCS